MRETTVDFMPLASERLAASPDMTLVRVRVRSAESACPILVVHTPEGQTSFAPLLPDPAPAGRGIVAFAFGIPTSLADGALGWAIDGGDGEIALDGELAPALTVQADPEAPLERRRDDTPDGELQRLTEAHARAEARAVEEHHARLRWQSRALAASAEKDEAVARLEELLTRERALEQRRVEAAVRAAHGDTARPPVTDPAHVDRLERRLEQVTDEAIRVRALADELAEALEAADRRATAAREEAADLAARLDEAAAARRLAERRLAMTSEDAPVRETFFEEDLLAG